MNKIVRTEIRFGDRRTIYAGSCFRCEKGFETTTKHQRFCSRQCYFLTKKVPVICVVCNQHFRVSPSMTRRNKKHYCSRKCYYLRSEPNKIKRHTAFYDRLLNSSTCECGISAFYLLQIHHIDGNENNNKFENLEVLCANCHIKRHLKRRNKDGMWVYSPKQSLTPRELLPFV